VVRALPDADFAGFPIDSGMPPIGVSLGILMCESSPAN